MAKRARKSNTARNPKIANRTVKRQKAGGKTYADIEANDEREQKLMDKKIASKREFANLAEELAGHKYYYRNWFWDHHRKHFQFEIKLRHVDLYFPFAIGGPLLIDQPMQDHEQKICERKRVEIVKAGFRYLILNSHMNENEAREELDKITNGGEHGLDNPGASKDLASATP